MHTLATPIAVVGIVIFVCLYLYKNGIFPQYKRQIAFLSLAITLGEIAYLFKISPDAAGSPFSGITPRQLQAMILLGGAGIIASHVVFMSDFIESPERRKTIKQFAIALSGLLVFIFAYLFRNIPN